MAIYHLSVKPIQRSKGRSATAAAAYRAGEKVVDERTGEVHDYTRKRGVVVAEIVMPSGSSWSPSRAELWNAAEVAEKRKDGTPAREHEVALPWELGESERLDLVRRYAQNLANRHGCAVDFAIHAPNDESLNHHAHILCSTRQVEGAGLGQKCEREQAGRKRTEDLDFEREAWAKFCNSALRRAGQEARVDHRSLAGQGITDREPTVHVGAAATALERRGQRSRRGEINRERLDAAVLKARLDGNVKREAIWAGKLHQVNAELSLAKRDQMRDLLAKVEAEKKAKEAEVMAAERAERQRQRGELQAKAAAEKPTPAPQKPAPVRLTPTPPPPPPKPAVEPPSVERVDVLAMLAKVEAEKKAKEAEVMAAERAERQRQRGELQAKAAAEKPTPAPQKPAPVRPTPPLPTPPKPVEPQSVVQKQQNRVDDEAAVLARFADKEFVPFVAGRDYSGPVLATVGKKLLIECNGRLGHVVWLAADLFQRLPKVGDIVEFVRGVGKIKSAVKRDRGIEM